MYHDGVFGDGLAQLFEQTMIEERYLLTLRGEKSGFWPDRTFGRFGPCPGHSDKSHKGWR